MVSIFSLHHFFNGAARRRSLVPWISSAVSNRIPWRMMLISYIFQLCELVSFVLPSNDIYCIIEDVNAVLIQEVVSLETLFNFLTVNAEHIASTGIYINAVSLWIVFCKYCSHRIRSLISFNHSLQKSKHFNQFTMSLLFCVILFYRFFFNFCPP